MFGGACGMGGGRATVGLDVDPLARVEGPTVEGVVEVGFVAALSFLSLSSPSRYANTFPVGDLRVSTSGLDSGMARGPSCDFGGIALQVVVTMRAAESCNNQQLGWATVLGCGMCGRGRRCE